MFSDSDDSSVSLGEGEAFGEEEEFGLDTEIETSSSERESKYSKKLFEDDELDKVLQDIKGEHLFCEHENSSKYRQQGLIPETLVYSQKQLDHLLDISKDLIAETTNHTKSIISMRNYEAMQKKDEMQDSIRKSQIECMAKIKHIHDIFVELQTFPEQETFTCFSSKFKHEIKKFGELADFKESLAEKCRQEYENSLLMLEKYLKLNQKDVKELSQRVLHQLELTRMFYNQQGKRLDKCVHMDWQQRMAETKNLFAFNLSKVNEHKKRLREIQAGNFETYYSLVANPPKLENKVNLEVEKAELDLFAIEMKREANIIKNKFNVTCSFAEMKNQEFSPVSKLYLARTSRTKYQTNMLRKKLDAYRAKSKKSQDYLARVNKMLHNSITEMEEKMNSDTCKQFNRFKDLFELTLKEIEDVANRVWDIDDALHEFERTERNEQRNFIDKKLYNDVISKANKANAINLRDRKSFKTKKDKAGGKVKDTAAENTMPLKTDAEKRFLRNIMHCIGNNFEYLVEKKLKVLLGEYPEKQGDALVQVTRIFEVLQVEDEKTLDHLMQTFRAFYWCAKCHQSAKDVPFNAAEQVGLKKAKYKAGKCHVKAEVKTKPCERHEWVTTTTSFLMGLNEFKNRYAPKVTIDTKKELAAVISFPTYKETSDFFAQFINIFETEQKSRWQQLEMGLITYRRALVKRWKLNAECERLCKQNSELRYLLRNHLQYYE